MTDPQSFPSPEVQTAWSGRFAEPVSDLVKRYTASVFFDQRMWRQDIRGSLAHARMLARQGIIAAADLGAIERGMATIVGEIEGGTFNWNLDDEDVHLNIEKRLTALVGDAGKRLHTGRSRNDQVATDIRLWLRDTIDVIDPLLRNLQEALLTAAETQADTPMPGFTHLQVAQPVTFGHHLLAYVEMLGRDRGRFADCRVRLNRLPLGAAALAGTTFPIDREFVARELGFDGICENSLDAVSDRDFAIEFCSAGALAMTHLSRFSEELILWMSPRVGFIDLAEEHAATPMPGFTHLQVAQPVTFGHHLMAYFEMAARDRERLADCRKRTNRLPLGAAALAGTTYPIDREFVAAQLGFEGVCENSLDAVSDRDFAIEFCAACALLMTHISRLSEELVMWMSPRVGFIQIADRFCTGSSIMPQKKNPDVPELARGKTGRVNGHLIALLTLMKSQPLAYNKDNQEDKEPLFDAVDTVTDTLRIFADMAGGITVKPEAMQAALTQGFATATDLADYLTKKGLPFRDAHEAVGMAVKAAEFKGVDLPGLTLEELQQFSPLIENGVYAVLTVEGSLASRNHIGGTAPEQVRAAIQRARNRL